MQENGDKGAPCAPAKKRKSEKRLAAFERGLLFSRWLQLPLFIGLVVALLVFEYKFAEHLFNNLAAIGSITREQAILVMLDLIDMVLIASLAVMVVISGYETFISPFHITDDLRIPTWMRRSTAGKLKLRIATTILLISTIHLLHDYLDPAQLDEAKVRFMLIAQIVFIVTAGAFVVFDRLEYGPKK